jgi:hypothetical protein
MTKNEAFSKVVRPAMEKFAHVGACDSDARDCIVDLFINTVSRKG